MSTATPGRIDADVIVIGAGIAGASIACWLAPHLRVIVLERESQPGYHSTGRSAALFMESYGPPQVRALTLASRAFFAQPPDGFAEHALLSPRGALFVATESQRAQLERHEALLASMTTRSRRLSPAEAGAIVPALRVDRIVGAVHEFDPADMDVHAIHHGYLRAMRRAGGVLVCDAAVHAIERSGAGWLVGAGAVTYRAPVIVDAAGAWVDAVARLAGVAPLGIVAKRRSALVFAPPAGLDSRAWPMVIGADEDWYIKPDAGLLLGSPANADPVQPQDVQPEELEIAEAIERIETMTTLRIARPLRRWAGLRSFVADGALVAGYDALAPGFFWLAGQGGYGIQTSAAMGEAGAALVRGLPLPGRIADFGLTATALSPLRLGSRASAAAVDEAGQA